MFVHQVYSIYDSKADSWSLPLFSMNDRVAIRQFGDAARHSGSEIALHPEDYTLYHVGLWNGGEPCLSGVDPRAVINGLQALNSGEKL